MGLVFLAFWGTLVAPSFAYVGLAVAGYLVDLAVRWATMRGTRYALTERHAIVLQTFPRRRTILVALEGSGAALQADTVHVGALAFEHVAGAKQAYERAMAVAGEGAVPARKGIAWGQVVAGLILLWLAVGVIQMATNPHAMGGG